MSFLHAIKKWYVLRQLRKQEREEIDDFQYNMDQPMSEFLLDVFIAGLLAVILIGTIYLLAVLSGAA